MKEEKNPQQRQQGVKTLPNFPEEAVLATCREHLHSESLAQHTTKFKSLCCFLLLLFSLKSLEKDGEAVCYHVRATEVFSF